VLDVRKDDIFCTFGVIVLEDSDGDIRCIVVDLTVECTAEDTVIDVVIAVPLGSRVWEVWIVGFVTALESPEVFSVGGLWHITSTSFP